MNFFIRETIFYDNTTAATTTTTNNTTAKRKKKTKLQKLLWEEYLLASTTTLENHNLSVILKKIKRRRQKCKKIDKDLGVYKSLPKLYPKVLTGKCIAVETTVQRTYERTTADDLSYIILNSAAETITTSTHLIFTCPVCFENDKLVDVILQCRHCVCKCCHEIMIEMETDGKMYFCPVCRRATSILEKEKGPILHYV